ncbi:hypothetical protein ACIA58_15890 [Kribbella sp. NPDC051586]|uniref:hypothetical protein n=1 Tax=Kribbella sp. NPDC051586 TaxID=3364118 RepID=UPI00379922C1
MTINGNETPRQAVERELHAAREKVRRMTEDLRARLADDEQAEADQQSKDDHEEH